MLTVTLNIFRSVSLVQTIFSYMSELQLVDSIQIWKAVLWCLYPMAALVLLELISRSLPDDDDDFGGGKMIPAYQPVRAR